MRKINSIAMPSILILLSIILTGCDGIIQPGDLTDIKNAVRGMNYLNQPKEMPNPIVVGPIAAGDSNYPDRPVDISGKTTEAYKVTDAEGLEELLLLNPSSPTIWLGSILDGNSITTGDYIPITAARAPMTISMSALKRSDGINSSNIAVIVDQPSIGNVRTGINGIVGTDADSIVCTPLSTGFDFHEVNSESELSMELGLSYRGWGSKLAVELDFSTTRKRTQMVAKFMQICYTVDVDITTGGPDSYFLPGVTWNDLAYSISSDVSPVIVSSVKYGRMGLFMFESDYSEDEVTAALKASYSKVFTVSGEVTVEQQNILDSTIMSVLVFGGTSKASNMIISGYDGFCDWITGMTKDCPFLDAVPLSYTLSYLKDASVARVVLASEYYKRVVVGEDTPVVVPKYSMVRIVSVKTNIRLFPSGGYPSSPIPLEIECKGDFYKYFEGYGYTGGATTFNGKISYTYNDNYPSTQLEYIVVFTEGLPLEIACIYFYTNERITSWQQTGPGTWGIGTSQWSAQTPKKVYLSDLNLTGYADIIVGNITYHIEGIKY